MSCLLTLALGEPPSAWAGWKEKRWTETGTDKMESI